MEAIDSLPTSFLISAIIDLLKNKNLGRDEFVTMTELYLKGDIAKIMALSDILNTDISKEDMLVFNTIMLYQRNAIMAKRAQPILEQGNSFIAVGAAHLIGKEGLIERFRQMGYTVTRVQ